MNARNIAKQVALEREDDMIQRERALVDQLLSHAAPMLNHSFREEHFLQRALITPRMIRVEIIAILGKHLADRLVAEWLLFYGVTGLRSPHGSNLMVCAVLSAAIQSLHEYEDH